MKVLIINGIPDQSNCFVYESALEKEIQNNTEHQIDYFVLRNMNINYCTGCWDCWMKTPGRCAIKDDQEQILSRIPNADKVLYISPVILGYESSLLKTCKDRSIPAIHPYISIYKGELHHHNRYESMPEINVLLFKDQDTTSEDVDLIEDTYKRMALNFRASVNYFKAIDQIEGVKNVLNRI